MLIVIAALVGIGAGSGATLHFTSKARHASEEQIRAEHADALADLHSEIEASAADLARCQAEVAPKSLDAAGRVLEASQATDIADLNLRAAVVSAIPATEYARAVIATGSPRSIGAAEALAGCRASNTTGDSSRSGCGPQGAVVQEWAAANASLSSCIVAAPTE